MKTFISIGVPALCGGVVGASLVLFLQQNYTVSAQTGSPGVIVAKELRLVDTAGRSRAELRVDEEGSVLLEFKTRAGEVLLGMYVDESTGGYLLTKAIGNKGYAMLGSAQSPRLGGSQLVFSDDRNGSNMIKLGFGPGHPGMTFTTFDADVPHTALEMTFDSESSPSLWLRSRRSATGVRVFAYEEREGGAAVQVLRRFETRAVLGNHQVKEARTGSTVSRPGSSLLLFDENGKIVTALP